MSQATHSSAPAPITYPFGDELPAAGTWIEIASGLRWLRMPLPFALDHINLWLLRDRHGGREGWTVVDTGIASDATRAAWERLFAEGFEGLPLLRVVVTHMHPDHIGLAHWLGERWGTPEQPCRMWISATDFNAARVASRMTAGFGGEGSARFFARHGLVDEEAQTKVRARSTYYASLVPDVPTTFHRLMDGMTIDIGGRAWRCIAGYGHAPEHISLHCAELGLLISGDMVLPRISTNVSVYEIEPEADPLPLYIASLGRLRELPAATLVLPSHGKPFRGLHPRIDQLVTHHDERFAEALAACAERPCSAADVVPVLFRRKLDLHQTTFAMGEAIAHLHALAGRGELQPQPGADGVLRWATVRRPAG